MQKFCLLRTLFYLLFLLGASFSVLAEDSDKQLSTTNNETVVENCVHEGLVVEDCIHVGEYILAEPSPRSTFTPQGTQGTCGLGWPVSSIKSTTTSNSITVSWEHAVLHNNDTQATYVVKHKLSSSGNWASIDVGAGTSATISDLAPEERYHVKVERSCDGVKRESDTKTIRTGDSDGEGSAFTSSCRLPTELSHDNLTATSVSLHYKKFNPGNSNVEEFSVIKIAEGPAQTPIPQVYFGTHVGGRDADDDIQGLNPNTTYHWWVEKHCKNTLGGVSDVASPSAREFTTSAVVENCPLTTGLHIDELRHNWGKIKWNSVAGSTSHTVAVSVNDAPWQFIEITNRNFLGTLDTELSAPLQPGTKYDIGVKTNCHGGTQSDWNWSERLIFTSPQP
ncbi:MAG: fibronectin type III domain-containing protein [Methylococcales bacterium]